MITNPEERSGADFIAFYAAGTVAKREGTQSVYDLLNQQAIQQEQVGFQLVSGQVLLYNHVPFLIPILQILVTPDYAASFSRWAFVLLMLYVVGAFSIVSLFIEDSDRKIPRILLGLSILTFFPLFVSILIGQDTAFLFLGASLWTYGLLRKKDWVAGLGLALTIVRPHLALLFALPFLFRRRKVLWGFLAGSIVLGLISFLLLGMEGTRDFIDLLLISAGGDWYGMKEAEMFNLLGSLFRLFPAADASMIRIIGWFIFGIAIVGLCVFWVRHKAGDERYLGIATIIALISVPHLHYHDLTLLLLPIVGILIINLRVGIIQPAHTTIFPLAISLVLLLGMVISPLKFILPYLVMIGLLVVLFYQGNIVKATPQIIQWFRK